MIPPGFVDIGSNEVKISSANYFHNCIYVKGHEVRFPAARVFVKVNTRSGDWWVLAVLTFSIDPNHSQLAID